MMNSSTHYRGGDVESPKRDAVGPTACRGDEREDLAGNSERLVSVVDVFAQGLLSLGDDVGRTVLFA